MRKVSGCIFALAVLAALVGGHQLVQAASRYYQSYSAKYSRGGYSYRYYNYYSPKQGGYKYHYAIYYAQRPRYVYYYNPYKKVYWGRYDLQAGGYSLLAPENRKGELNEIAEAAFPPPGTMPPVPDSEGDEPMLPPVEALQAQQPRPSMTPVNYSRSSPVPAAPMGHSCQQR